MLDKKDSFSVHSPDPLQCGDPRSRLDASLRLGAPLSWEMKDEQIQKPASPRHFSWLIFVARGPESPANGFGREPDICLILEYFLPCLISFPNSRNFSIVYYFCNYFPIFTPPPACSSAPSWCTPTPTSTRTTASGTSPGTGWEPGCWRRWGRTLPTTGYTGRRTVGSRTLL